MLPITQAFVSALIILFIVFIIFQIRKDAIDYKYALVWIVLTLILLVLTIFPSIMLTLARLVGVEVPLNLLSFAGILICLFFTFRLAMSFSKLKRKTYLLTQQIAILQKTVKDLTQAPPQKQDINH